MELAVRLDQPSIIDLIYYARFQEGIAALMLGIGLWKI